MRESLGYAAVNQQHYLDLGYSESVVQTRAAEWTAATELPWIIPETGVPTRIGKGIMQASRLMNRWGVFRRNGSESLETLADRDLNYVRSAQNRFSVKSPNAAEASSAKYRALEAAQNKAVKSEILDDGRIRYYKNEIPARKPGPTRGAAYVTEYNPKTGDVYTWMESYDQLGNVNRIHPKMYNGQELHAPHYPLTLKDKIEAELYSSRLRR